MNIEFDNYIIRPLEQNHLLCYFDFVNRNRKRLENFFSGTVSKTNTLEETIYFIREMLSRRSSNEYYPYLMINKVTNEFVSFIDLKNIDWSIPKSELGCYTCTEYTGKGITTVAIQQFVNHSFLEFNFKKIFLRTHVTNIAAQNIAEKCGFEREGIIRMDYKTTSGRIVDLIYYGKLNDNYSLQEK
jgi:RimJ/RimL family protein N-acetyltransferase